MKKSIKLTVCFLSLGLILMGFQNCADDLDLSQLEAASTPGVSFAQTSVNPVENSSFEMRMVGNNLSNVTYRWEKDGQTVANENTDILSFDSLEFSDNGIYEGIAVVNGTDVYRTGVRELIIEADPNEPLVQTINNPRLTLNGANYNILSFSTRSVAQHQQINNEYCQAVFGSQATGTGYNNTLVTISTNRYVIWFINGTTCPLTTYDGQLGPGFCLFTNNNLVTTTRYTSLSCNRYPDYVAP